MKPAESKASCVPQILQKLSLTKERARTEGAPKEKPVPQAGSERCSKPWPVLVIVPMARMLQPHAGEMLRMTEFRQKGRSTFSVLGSVGRSAKAGTRYPAALLEE